MDAPASADKPADQAAPPDELFTVLFADNQGQLHRLGPLVEYEAAICAVRTAHNAGTLDINSQYVYIIDSAHEVREVFASDLRVGDD